jgi:hypothetical protein
MRAMENRQGHVDTPLTIAYLASVLIHIVVLSLSISPPGGGKPEDSAPQRLDVALAKRPIPSAQEPVAEPTPKPPVPPNRKPNQQVITAAPTAAPTPMTWPTRTWSRNERSEMEKFLTELATEVKPASKPQQGKELAAQALATARLPETPPEGTDTPPDIETLSTGPSRKSIDKFSMEMYFDAFVNKLNRSAAFVRKENRKSGYRKALVQLMLNSDGTLKSYEVLRSGDQESEIAYIKSVVDRASPFSAFPRDIAGVTGVLSIFICIVPSGGDGGGSFSRTSAQECRD